MLLAGADSLDQDPARGAVAEGDAGSVDLTEDGAAPGNLGHKRRLTESHLPDPLAEFGIPIDPAHATGRAGRQLAQGCWGICRLSCHCRGINEELRLIFKKNFLESSIFFCRIQGIAPQTDFVNTVIFIKNGAFLGENRPKTAKKA
ncbi:MAG TPA: hypothetical protein VN877_03590 [Opitutaceae bacterium]|nr:hypothetical protein [Opitutaceae bacterium]